MLDMYLEGHSLIIFLRSPQNSALSAGFFYILIHFLKILPFSISILSSKSLEVKLYPNLHHLHYSPQHLSSWQEMNDQSFNKKLINT